MKKITDIYEEYKIAPLLRLHQIRVAAVATMICDSLKIPVDKDSIVKACLFHDMGNIIKFNLNDFPEENGSHDLKYWKQIQVEFIEKYGNDEHSASVKIARELNLPQVIIDLVDSVKPSFVLDGSIINGSDWAKKICNYADQRVTPHGVVSIEERNSEARERYKNHPHAFSEENSHLFLSNIKEIEKQIFSHSKIKPEDINDESVVVYFEKLKDF